MPPKRTSPATPSSQRDEEIRRSSATRTVTSTGGTSSSMGSTQAASLSSPATPVLPLGPPPLVSARAPTPPPSAATASAPSAATAPTGLPPLPQPRQTEQQPDTSHDDMPEWMRMWDRSISQDTHRPSNIFTVLI